MAIGAEIGRQQADGHGASQMRVSRPVEIAWTGRLETRQQVVVGDDANGRWGRGHARSVSITLCTSSFPAPLSAAPEIEVPAIGTR